MTSDVASNPGAKMLLAGQFEFNRSPNGVAPDVANGPARMTSGQRAGEVELAWALADAAKPQLNARERNDVFAAIGAGETFAAIRVLLKSVATKKICVRPDLAQQCVSWLDSYVGHEHENFLRHLIEDFVVPYANHGPATPRAPWPRQPAGPAQCAWPHHRAPGQPAPARWLWVAATGPRPSPGAGTRGCGPASAR